MVSARNGIYYCSNMGQLAERLRRKFVALVNVGLNPSLPPKYEKTLANIWNLDFFYIYLQR